MEGAARVAWGFRPRPRVPTLEEERRFQGELRTALRIAAGFGLGVSVRWESGRTGGIALGADGRSGASWVRRVLRPVYPAGQWSPLATEDPPDSGPALGVATLAGPDWLPLPFTVDRPPWSEAVLRAFATLAPGVRVDWECRAGPARGAILPGGGNPFEAPPTGTVERGRPFARLERDLHDRATERAHGLLWMVRAEMRASGAAAPNRAADAARVIATASRLEGGNALRFRRRIPALRPRARWMVFSEAELAGLFPTPWVRGLSDRPMRPNVFGLPVGQGADGHPVVLPVEREEGRHLIVVGETGMGKSSLLVQLLRAASRRDAVVLLDPIGDTGRSFLGAVPPAHRPRVTWVSPTDAPIGLNALRVAAGAGRPPHPEREARAVPELTAALRRVRSQRYVESGFWGPRVEEGLGRALQLASAIPGGTLREAYALLDDPASVVLPVPPALSGALHAFAAFVRERPEEVAGSRRVLGEIVGNPVLGRMLCERSATYDLSSAGEPGAITVLTAEAPRVGEATARALLAVDLALLWTELLARPHTTKVFLALEEAQWYAHESLLELLRLGRRSNVHVWTATQSLRSLGEPLREALLTNSADLVLFRGDPEEAREFSRWSAELAPERLMALERGEAMVLLGKGTELRWCRTDPPGGQPLDATALRSIAEESRRRWSPEPPPPPPSERREPAPDEAPRALRALDWAARTYGLPAHVPIRRMAQELNLTREELRREGSELQRRGILVRSYTTPEGRFWELRAPTVAPQGSPERGEFAGEAERRGPERERGTCASEPGSSPAGSEDADEPKGH